VGARPRAAVIYNADLRPHGLFLILEPAIFSGALDVDSALLSRT
jgi:hypothetical protein